MSSEQKAGTPWQSIRDVRATRDQAIPPDEAARMRKGPPPQPGRLPGETVPPEEGVPPEAGVPPDAGVPRGAGKLPGEDGQKLPGTPNQVPRGAPGQMDPWAENPWAPGADWDDEWQPAVPEAGAEDAEDDFYMQHPNFMGADGAPPGDLPAEDDDGKGD